MLNCVCVINFRIIIIIIILMITRATVLCLVCLCSDRVEAMEMLIVAGTDINVLNHKHHSPLQIAVSKPSKHCVAALLRHESCNVNQQVLICNCPLSFYIIRYSKVQASVPGASNKLGE